MAVDSCSYDCSSPPGPLYANPDISGIGVSLGYIITAGTAVGIVTVYYFVAYHPDADPFADINDSPSSGPRAAFKPNQIDHCILWLFGRKHLRQHGPAEHMSRKRAFVHRALIKSMLALSDLQLFTGLSIMISGYAQIRCGIAVYHWQRLVNTAWFASITHLASLTFLRGYLHQHPTGRLWRSICMTILVLLLLVAILPTGYFRYSAFESLSTCSNIQRIDPSMPMVCFIRLLYDHKKIWIGDPDCRDPEAKLEFMAVSMILLGLGMIQRLIRLYQISNDLILVPRKYVSQRCKHFLSKIYNRYGQNQADARLKLTLVYYPCLSCFLTLRFTLDFVSSMVFEVWWLLLSYSWGISRLMLNDYAESNAQGWTFGQVAPLVLLIAPFVAILEAFDIEKSQEMSGGSHVTAPSPVALPRQSGLSTNSALVDHPSADFYMQSTWIRPLVSFILLAVVFSSAMGLWMLVGAVGIPPTLLLVPSSDQWIPLSLTIPFGIYYCILFSLILRKGGGNRPRSWISNKIFRVLAWILYLFDFLLFVVWPVLPSLIDFSPDIVLYFVVGTALLYIGFALLEALGSKLVRALFWF